MRATSLNIHYRLSIGWAHALFLNLKSDLYISCNKCADVTHTAETLWQSFGFERRR